MDPCIIVQFLQRKTQQDATVYQILVFLILNEAHHVLGNTPPIIRSLKLHKQPLVLHTWKVVGQSGSVYTLPDNIQKLHV